MILINEGAINSRKVFKQIDWTTSAQLGPRGSAEIPRTQDPRSHGSMGFVPRDPRIPSDGSHGSHPINGFLCMFMYFIRFLRFHGHQWWVDVQVMAITYQVITGNAERKNIGNKYWNNYGNLGVIYGGNACK